jgi:hypothetical protein
MMVAGCGHYLPDECLSELTSRIRLLAPNAHAPEHSLISPAGLRNRSVQPTICRGAIARPDHDTRRRGANSGGIARWRTKS